MIQNVEGLLYLKVVAWCYPTRTEVPMTSDVSCHVARVLREQLRRRSVEADIDSMAAGDPAAAAGGSIAAEVVGAASGLRWRTGSNSAGLHPPAQLLPPSPYHCRHQQRSRAGTHARGGREMSDVIVRRSQIRRRENWRFYCQRTWDIDLGNASVSFITTFLPQG